MLKRSIAAAALVALSQIVAYADHGHVTPNDGRAMPKEGFVPNAETAIRIAEAVWIPIYGEKQIASEKPFKTTLSGGTWTVTGTMDPKYALGGVAEIEISKQDGRIFRVVHGE